MLDERSARAALIDQGTILMKRAQEARGRARRAQQALLAAQARALRAASGGAADRRATREQELQRCLAQLHATSRALDKALTDVARETQRVTRLLKRTQESKTQTPKRVLPFHR